MKRLMVGLINLKPRDISKQYERVKYNMDLDSFGFQHPLSEVIMIPCIHCGRKTRLEKNRVLYCMMCSVGFLHPNYNWDLDKIIK